MKKLLALLVVVFALAQAQEGVVISPQSIVVNPKPSFTVEVWVDKDPSGNGAPSYEIGEGISIGVRVSEAAYVYLFNVKSNGEIQQILPNRYDQAGQNNYLSAGETKYFPPQDASYTFGIDGPRGLDKVIALASKEQLDARQLADFSADPNFATSSQGEESFAQTLSIVVRPKPQESWVTDTALFYVGSAPQTPVYGTLDISSSPSGAAAYVDGQFVGYTPVRFGTRAGSHEVRVELSGYDAAQQRVELQGGRTQSVQLTLARTQPQGITVTPANPGGDGTVISDELGLSLQNVRVLRLDQRRGRVRAELETSTSIKEIYSALHAQLRSLGWRQVGYDEDGRATRITAEYRSGARRLELNIDARGKSGRVTVEIDD